MTKAHLALYVLIMRKYIRKALQFYSSEPTEPQHNPISKAQKTNQSIMGVACVRHGSPIDFRYFTAVD